MLFLSQKTFVILFLFISTVFAATTTIKHTVNIGILSFRPINENQKIWLPLGRQLHDLSPQFDFNITSHTQDDIVQLVAQEKLDFAIVHPGAFVEMETKYGASNIASLVRQASIDGKHLTKYGGAIAVLSSNKDIHTLQDLRGKTIATTHKDGFAVMLVQQDVLANVGIDVLNDCKMLYTGQPIDNIIDALKNGNADVGFFRTGYIEEMISNGKLKSGELSIINQVSDNNYPYAYSTRLYPEWAVVAMAKTDDEVIKAVTTALYQIHSDSSSDYHEFSVPLSYKSTRELMQKYYIYPFKKTQIGLADTLRYYSVYIFPIILLMFVIAIVVAIAYRRQTRRVEEQKVKIEAILITASDGIHVHDLEGNLLYFSDSFASMLGYSRGETSKLNIFDWNRYFDPDKIRHIIASMVNGEAMFETKHTRKDGSEFDVEIFAKSIELDGKVYIHASARDITQRKNMEVELIKNQIIFQSIAEGVYAVDNQNKITYINQTALDMLGLYGVDVKGKIPHELFHYHGIDGNIYPFEVCPIFKAAESGIPARLEELFIRVDGTFFPVVVTVSPIIQDDSVVGSVVVFVDITKQKEVERNLQALVTEETDRRMEQEKMLIQQSKMATMGELVGAIAHQWRQPLNALAVGVQDIEITYQLEEMNAEYVERFVNNSMNTISFMSSTIDTFRNFYMPNTKMESFNLLTIIKQSIDILSAQFEASGVKIILQGEVVCDGCSNGGYGYPSNLKQVILNILSNAKDAIVTKKESVDGEYEGQIFISIACKSDTNGVRQTTMSFGDNGGGIAADIMDRIFEPYFTTKEQGRGTGIGLYMTKNIVERHMKGELKVSNTEVGALFSVSFNPDIFREEKLVSDL